MSMTTSDDGNNSRRRLQTEQDPAKLMELSDELNHKLQKRARIWIFIRARCWTERRCVKQDFLERGLGCPIGCSSRRRPHLLISRKFKLGATNNWLRTGGALLRWTAGGGCPHVAAHSEVRV